MDGGGYAAAMDGTCGDGYNDGVKTMVVVIMENEADLDTWKKVIFHDRDYNGYGGVCGDHRYN